MSNAVKSRDKPLSILHGLAVQWFKVADPFHVVLATLLVMVPISPLFMPVIRRDSGVFLYIGWRMLAGELPFNIPSI